MPPKQPHDCQPRSKARTPRSDLATGSTTRLPPRRRLSQRSGSNGSSRQRSQQRSVRFADEEEVAATMLRLEKRLTKQIAKKAALAGAASAAYKQAA